MNFEERRKLSRRIERGLFSLYQSHKRQKRKAEKLLAEYRKTVKFLEALQEQRLLLLVAKAELWEK